MAVYDVAGGQQLAQPVSAFAQGKAMRLALQNDALKNRAAELQIEAAEEELARAPKVREQQDQAHKIKVFKDFMAGGGAELVRKGDFEGANQLAQQFGMPPATPEQFETVRNSLAEQEEEYTLGPGQRRFKGGEVVAEVPATEGQTPSEVIAFRSMTEGLSEEEREQARRIELGLSPRAVGNADITAATGAAGVTPEQIGGAAGTVSGGRKAGEQAVEMSGQAMEQLGKVRQNIQTIDSAIEAIDAGANTGAIASRLPSVQAASVTLENVQAQMGLDVIGATTFGSLSEEELKFALSAAMPTGLDEPELRKWLERKKEAQQKLAAELEGAAIFLGTPGNTPAKYLQFMREQGALEFPEQGESEPADVSAMSDEDLLKELEGAK